ERKANFSIDTGGYRRNAATRSQNATDDNPPAIAILHCFGGDSELRPFFGQADTLGYDGFDALARFPVKEMDGVGFGTHHDKNRVALEGKSNGDGIGEIPSFWRHTFPTQVNGQCFT